jgi:acyl-CoA hydrolase
MRISPACVTVASVLLCPIAFADSAACRAQIFDANQKSMETPNHNFLSQIESGPKGLVTKSEMINVGNESYIKLVDVHAGKTQIGDDSWSVARRSPQDTAKATLEAMRDAVKETKNYQCAHVRDETIDGVAAAVYSEHAETEEGNSDALTWISKNQGLIIKYQANIGDMTITSRYVYTDIRAPANAKGPDQ